MRREQLVAILAEVERVMDAGDIVVIGSQCVHAITQSAPAEVVISLECDVLIDESDPASKRIDDELGPGSPFHDAHQIYVDTVPSEFPFLPAGWKQRLLVFEGVTHARCLEIHDLAISKLAAGRLKDYELVSALISFDLAQADVIRNRIGLVDELRMRAILLARLQIVLESVGR